MLRLQFSKVDTQLTPISPMSGKYIQQVKTLCDVWVGTKLFEISRVVNQKPLNVEQEYGYVITLLSTLVNAGVFDYSGYTEKLDYLNLLSIQAADDRLAQPEVLHFVAQKLCASLQSELSELTSDKLFSSATIFEKFHKMLCALTHSCFSSRRYHHITFGVDTKCKWLSETLTDTIIGLIDRLFDLVLDLRLRHPRYRTEATIDWLCELSWAKKLMPTGALTADQLRALREVQPTGFHATFVWTMELLVDFGFPKPVSFHCGLIIPQRLRCELSSHIV